METMTLPAAQIKARLAGKCMELRLRWSPPDVPADTLLAEVARQAKQLGVVRPAAGPEVESRIAAARSAAIDGVCEACVLNGTPPTSPADESVQWSRDFFNAPYKVDEQTGKIDYRERLESSQVAADELIATIRPATPGTPGADLLGKPIQPRSPRKAQLACGRNIRFDAGKRSYFAKCAGRLRCSGNRLAIDDTMEIAGSVGMASGNIHFSGHVMIARDIEDMATVEADGGVDVGNVIGMAKVTSGGDIRVSKGIAGKDRGQVIAAGGVFAGYIANSQVQADGDIEVHSEILRGDIRCRGNVRVASGRIVGGQVVALGQIETVEAGSEAGVATLLAAGEDYALPAALAEEQTSLASIAAHAEQLRGQIARLTAMGRELSASQRESVTELMFQAQEAEAALAQCQRRVDLRVLESEQLAIRVIVVKGVVHPGVTLRISGEAMLVNQPIRGPVRITLAQDDNGKRLVVGR